MVLDEARERAVAVARKTLDYPGRLTSEQAIRHVEVVARCDRLTAIEALDLVAEELKSEDAGDG